MSNQELKPVDMTGYTNQMWLNKLKAYLADVMGMNDKQVKAEFIRRGWSELLQSDFINDKTPS